MVRTVFFILALGVSLFADAVKEMSWDNGKTFLNFLEDYQIPLKTYYDLSAEDKELAEEIVSGESYFVSTDDSGESFRQALIPIGGENQIHIYKEGDSYELKIIPINYITKKDYIVVEITNSVYQDIYDLTKDRALASEVVSAFKNSVNFKRYLRKGDKAVASYESKIRLGKRFGPPTVEAAMVEVSGRPNFVIAHEDGKYYDQNGRVIEGFYLSVPLVYKRISSHFTKSRYHPVLKIRRPHLGIDYAAPTGTRINASADGRVIFKGVKGGYGNTIIIQHDYGFQTLYAHLSRYKPSLKRGSSVKKGELIGYVGTTGVSTGPHLHFGVYKNSQAINPNSAITVVKEVLKGKDKEKFDKIANGYKSMFEGYIMAYNRGEYEYNPTYLAYFKGENVAN